MVNLSKNKIFDISQLDQLDKVIVELTQALNPNASNVVYLMGDLGCGKTTLAQHWLRYLGIDGAIPSPTYNIVNEYIGCNGHYIHADLYRISDPEELLYLDVREWREQASLILIEWPEQGRDYIPKPDMLCRLSLMGDHRELLWQTNTKVVNKQDRSND